MNQIEFLNKCEEKHGNRYDYSLSVYKNSRTNIKIICEEHGIFEQNPKHHYMSGYGCPSCSGNKRYTWDEYIRFFKSENKYIGYTSDDKVNFSPILFYPNSGLYKNIKHKQNAGSHLKSNTCNIIESNSLIKRLDELYNNQYEYYIDNEYTYKSCTIRIYDKLVETEYYIPIDEHLRGVKPNGISLNKFLLICNEKHEFKYDYSLIKNINKRNNFVDIICKEHGIFKQMVSNHMIGQGCPNCSKQKRLSQNDVIERFKSKHGERYDYSLVKFKRSDIKVDIICKEHGIFKQTPSKHYNGNNCPKCGNKSIGEYRVRKYLESNNISFIEQKTFSDCKYINKLRFDFYLIDLNICIEYDGEMHYENIFNDLDFENVKKRDTIKNEYCKSNNIKLIRIPYYEFDRIEEILSNSIKNNLIISV